jgi:hypothetical protein
MINYRGNVDGKAEIFTCISRGRQTFYLISEMEYSAMDGVASDLIPF